MADIVKAIKFLVVGDTSKASSAFKGLSKDMRETAKSGTGFRGLGKDLREAVKSGQGIKGVKGVFKSAATEAGGLKGMIGKVGIGIAAVGAAAVAAGVAIAIKFGADSIEVFKKVAGEVAGLKRVTGMTTEDASRLGFALKQSGVDAATGNKSMTIFAKNVVKMSEADKAAKTKAAEKAAAIRDQIAALQKAGPSVKGYADKMSNLKDKLAEATAGSRLNTSALGDLGVKYTDASGKLLPMAKLLPKIADKFAKMPDGAEKSAMAMKLFGKSGTAMIPFLNKGAAGLAELAKKSDALGNTLTDKQLDALKQSKQAQREWDAAMQGLQVTLGANLLPMLTDGAKMLNSVMVPALQGMAEWVHNNETTFTSLGNIMRWVWNNALLPLIKAAITGFVQMQMPLAYAVQALGKLTGNSDLENFGNGLVKAGEDAKRFADNLQGIPDEVTPTLSAKDQATAKIKAIDTKIKTLKDKLLHLSAEDKASGKAKKIKEEIDKLRNKSITLKATVRLEAKIDKAIKKAGMQNSLLSRAIMGHAAGGIVHAYAAGGVESHDPRIYRRHDGIRMFNEPETRGESYIPLANDWRRPRAVAIWRQTGRELGVYAGGGMTGGKAAMLAPMQVYITVEGDTDPVGAGRRIARYLTELQRATGGRPLPFVAKKS